MGTKAFRYDFKMKELRYLLFSSKNCPKCNNKMKKSKGYELVDGVQLSTASTPLYIQGRKEVKHYCCVYKCTNCGKQYTLKELAQKTNKEVEK